VFTFFALQKDTKVMSQKEYAASHEYSKDIKAAYGKQGKFIHSIVATQQGQFFMDFSLIITDRAKIKIT
jgi:hypothetical protein